MKRVPSGRRMKRGPLHPVGHHHPLKCRPRQASPAYLRGSFNVERGWFEPPRRQERQEEDKGHGDDGDRGAGVERSWWPRRTVPVGSVYSFHHTAPVPSVKHLRRPGPPSAEDSRSPSQLNTQHSTLNTDQPVSPFVPLLVSPVPSGLARRVLK